MFVICVDFLSHIFVLQCIYMNLFLQILQRFIWIQKDLKTYLKWIKKIRFQVVPSRSHDQQLARAVALQVDHICTLCLRMSFDRPVDCRSCSALSLGFLVCRSVNLQRTVLFGVELSRPPAPMAIKIVIERSTASPILALFNPNSLFF